MAVAQDSIQHRRDIVNRHNRKKQARTEAEIAYPAEKRCAGCRETKPAAAFSKHGISKDGLRPRCKVCIARAHAEMLDARGRTKRMSAALVARLGIEAEVPPVEQTDDGPIMRVPLTQGAFAVIDAADWPIVSGRNWHLIESGYAVTNGDVGGKKRLVYMHVLIHGDPDTSEVDHRDLDKLNNRRGNLRSATSSLNKANRRKPSHSESPFKGVRLLPSGRWNARIRLHGLERNLGTFATSRRAAEAYDAAARELFGEFAVVNLAT